MVEKSDNQEEANVNNKLFSGVCFVISKDIKDVESIKKILVDKGGKHVNYVSESVTHVIADDPNDFQVSDGEIYDKVSVTSQWVLLSEKANVLLPLEPFYVKKSSIFTNLTVAISSSLSKDDRSKLWAMFTFYGGEMQLNLTERCTHLVTSKCKGKKYEKACKLPKLKIVSPDWILDSIGQGKLCEVDDYHPKYLITPEYLQLKREREERLRLEEEAKRKEEQRKLEEDRKRAEEEKKRNEEKKRFEEEQKRRIDEERKKMQEEAAERARKAAAAAAAAAANVVQNKLSTVNISSSTPSQSTNSSAATSQPSGGQPISTITVPAILTTQQQTTTSSNVPTSGLRTVPSSTMSNMPVQQQTTVNSPAKQNIKVLLSPSNQFTKMPANSTIHIRPLGDPSGLGNQPGGMQPQQQQQTPQQQLKARIIAPHSAPLNAQQGQLVQNIYPDQSMNSQQQGQPIQYQQLNTQVNAIQKPMNQTYQQQPQQPHQNQNQNYQPQANNPQAQQLRTGDQMGNNAPRQIYFAVQQSPIQYRQTNQQFNFIQIRPTQQQFATVQQAAPNQQQQQQQQIRPMQSNQQMNHQQMIGGATIQQHPQQTIVSTASGNVTPKMQSNEIGQPNNTGVQKSTNIILQQRVQPPVQMQAQQNQQQANMQNTTNLQPMIIQQPNAGGQMTGNAQMAQQQPNQSIQVLPTGQQLIRIGQPVHGQIGQQQMIRGQNQPQQIIFQPANNLQQNGPRGQTQLQTIPQGAIFQQSPNQNQIQRVHQLKMPQNMQQSPNPQVRLATVSGQVHSQVPGMNPTQQQPNQMNQAQMKQQQQQQRFLIKSPPQYQPQPQQQNAPTSMITIRAPIQNQQQMGQMNQQMNQMNQNQMQTKMVANSTPPQSMGQQGQPMLPQTNKPQVANKFAANQAGGQIRNQWTGPNEYQQQPNQQMMRPVTPNQQQQMMQIGPNQVIMSPAIVQHGGQQTTTMILQGQPHNLQQHTIQQHQINQGGQWSTAQIAGPNQQQQQQPQLVQTRPVGGQNVQMHTIQHQPIRLVQPTTPTTPQSVVNRLQTPTTMSAAPPPLVTGGYSATPTITDPNVSTQPARPDQVNYIISSASLQSLKNGDQSIANSLSNSPSSSLVVTSKTKSALANLLNNRLKNSVQPFAGSSVASKKDGAASPNKTVEVSNKAIDALRSLDGCSPNSNSSSNSLFDYAALEADIVVERYHNYDSKLNVPSDFCLIGCVFYIVEYDEGIFRLDETKRRSIESQITRYGGQLASEYSAKVTHVICESSSNPLVQRALKECKRCVTVFWLDDVLEDKKMRYPYRPWHLPRKFNLDSSPCKDKIISISNFNTHERNRINEMIILANGKFTSYMTPQNNLLICKKFEGKKLNKAIEWGINVVNHLWLQDIWFGRPLKEISDRRYTVTDKDTVDLDYTLTKNLMVGWRTSLKLNEQDAKRLSEFKEASASAKKRANSTETASVLVSKENIIQDAACNPKPTDKNSNLSSNQNSNPSNEPPRCPPNSSTPVSTTPNGTDIIAPSSSTPVPSSTSAISNQTDTLTTVAATTGGDKASQNSSTIHPTSAASTSSSSAIKTEHTADSTNPSASSNQPNSSSSTSTTTTDQKLIDEASIKKEKLDDESMDTSKVPTSDEKGKEAAADSSNLMEVDPVLEKAPVAASQTESNKPPTQSNSQSTEIKPASEQVDNKADSLKVQPNSNAENNVESTLSNATPANDSSSISNAVQKAADSTILVTTATSPAILTVASVTSSQANSGHNDSKEPGSTIGLVNGDCNPNKPAELEMMEVDEQLCKKTDGELAKNAEPSAEASSIPNHKTSSEADPIDGQPPAKRMKSEIKEQMDVQSDSIDSKPPQQTNDVLAKEPPTTESLTTEPPAKEPQSTGSTVNNVHSKEGEENTDSSNLQLAAPPAKTGNEDNVAKSSWSPETIRVCITNTPNSKELSDIVSSLGGKVTTVPSECTHLVSSKVERTVKFVCAFNYARFILDPEWLVKSKESGCFLREHDYFLSDPANEQQFGITIGESLERRRQRENRPLFQDMIFFITRSCVPSLKILIQIVRSAGGLAVVKYAPTAQHLEAMKNRNLTFVVISCKNDLHLCNQFYERDIPVLHSEFVLSNILKQTIEYEPYMID